MNNYFNKTLLVSKKISFTRVLFVMFCFSIINLTHPHLTKAEVVFENLPDNKIYNDFAVGPGKIEMELSPGQTGTFDLLISNRLGTEKTFDLSIEDFEGSSDPKQTVVLLGDDRGPYSLRDYIKLGTTTFDLRHGNRARVPVSVSVPINAEPGGLYGSVTVGTVSKASEVANTTGVVSTNPVFTRIGVLIFIRVKGQVKEDGKLVDFGLNQNKKIITGIDDVVFNLFFKNDGNVHLNPKGNINISNILGSNVGNIVVEPWFAMPKSMRFREVSWKPKFLFGRYTAVATVDRGYGQIKDQLTYKFWVVPWKILLLVFVITIMIVVFVRKVIRKVTDRS